MSSEGDRPVYERGVGKHDPKRRSEGNVSTRQRHIAHVAQKYAGTPMTTLSHHMDLLWMHEAFARVRVTDQIDTVERCQIKPV